MKKGFTLLELILVIAIIASIAGMIIVAMNPTQRLQDVNSTKGLANSNDIEKALKAYITENNGIYPPSVNSLVDGYYDICNVGYSSGCINLASDLIPDYLSAIPKSPTGSTTELSGFKLGYKSVSRQLDVYTDEEYQIIAEGLIPEDWWNSDYGYRKPITIANTSGSTQTDYQILISMNTQTLITASKMKSDCGDLRITNASETEIGYWIESGCNTSSTLVWAKVASIPTTGTSIYVYYGNSLATTTSSINNTFIDSSISHFYGACNNATYCGYLDSHAEADFIRSSLTISSSNLVTAINDNTGTDYFFRRYRFLFKPAETGTYYFSVDSDDASEIGLFPGDGYGGGHSTGHPFGAHTLVSYWYGGHGSGTCGISSTVGTVVMSTTQGYWMDYLMNEWDGGQFASLCIRRPSNGSYFAANTTNFPGQFFARKYTSGAEPTATLGSEEDI